MPMPIAVQQMMPLNQPEKMNSAVDFTVREDLKGNVDVTDL